MFFDVSVLLVFLLKEEGGFEVLKVVSFQFCWISSVILIEVQGKFVGCGVFIFCQVEVQLGLLLGFVCEVFFESVCWKKVLFYYVCKLFYGLSFGDVVCLGIVEVLKLDVLIVEKGWVEIFDLFFKVQLICQFFQ